jgi:phytoene dehydrogenase-like protein
MESIIGEFSAPSSPGSAYVLLHHVMGDVGFGRGIWAFVQGGNGALSEALADSCKEFGVEIHTDAGVDKILVDCHGTAVGVVLGDDAKTEIHAKCVISNVDPYTTLLGLVDAKDQDLHLPPWYKQRIQDIDYSSATFKVNVAVNKIPEFTAYNSKHRNAQGAGHEHFGTIHLSETMQEIENSYSDAKYKYKPSDRPVFEMTIPSAMDPTMAPPGQHVVQFFCQYAPYALPDGQSWDDPGRRNAFAESVYNIVEEYAPGFKESIIGEDLLSPLDLERVIGLRGGHIFHGSMRLDQLYCMRPVYGGGYSRYETPIKNLYLAGSGAHPGGGVMGAAGRNCSNVILHKI